MDVYLRGVMQLTYKGRKRKKKTRKADGMSDSFHSVGVGGENKAWSGDRKGH